MLAPMIFRRTFLQIFAANSRLMSNEPDGGNRSFTAESGLAAGPVLQKPANRKVKSE